MKDKRHSALLLAAACTAACGVGGAHAAVSVFTTQASFLAAATAVEVDTFDSLFPGSIPSSPLTRATPTFGYTATTGPNYPYFFNESPGANRWLAAGDLRDTVTFASLTAGAQAIGGNFFDSVSSNNTVPVVASGRVSLTVRDSFGVETTVTIADALPSTFVGFVSTGTIVSLALTDPDHTHFVSADNLNLGRAAVVPVVPEPPPAALFVAGLGLLGAAVRHRPR